MNIFVLDTDVKLCAKYHCDKHLVKMITEHNQILGSIAHSLRGVKSKKDITSEYVWKNFQKFPRVNQHQEPFPYGIGYKNHPCTKWAASSLSNYNWLCRLTDEMCKEYTNRYQKVHVGERICDWYFQNPPPNLPNIQMTPFVQAMPEELKIPNDAVSAYRNYYMKHKSKFAKWKNGPPEWWNVDLK